MVLLAIPGFSYANKISASSFTESLLCQNRGACSGLPYLLEQIQFVWIAEDQLRGLERTKVQLLLWAMMRSKTGFSRETPWIRSSPLSKNLRNVLPTPCGEALSQCHVTDSNMDSSPLLISDAAFCLVSLSWRISSSWMVSMLLISACHQDRIKYLFLLCLEIL